jgi:hypothetical protein
VFQYDTSKNHWKRRWFALFNGGKHITVAKKVEEMKISHFLPTTKVNEQMK